MADVQQNDVQVGSQQSLGLDDVKSYLTANKEKDDVKEFLGTLSGGLDVKSVEAWFSENDEGKKALEKFTDKRVTQSIETFKKNHFAEAVKAEVEKEISARYPDETEEQKRIRELEKKFAAKDIEAKRQKNTNYALRAAQENELGSLRSILHLVKDDDSEDDISAKIRDFKEDMAFVAKQAVNKILNKGKRTDISGDEEHTFTKEELARMTPDEYKKHRATIQAQLQKK